LSRIPNGSRGPEWRSGRNRTSLLCKPESEYTTLIARDILRSPCFNRYRRILKFDSGFPFPYILGDVPLTRWRLSNSIILSETNSTQTMPSQTSSDQALHSLEEENKRLKRAVDELSILNDLARAIGASLNTQEIIQTIVRRSLRALNAEQGVITLVEEQSVQSMKTLVRTMVSSGEREQFHLNQALLGWMHLNKKPIVISDPRTDERFQGVPWDESLHSLLAVPLMVKSELRGVITIYNKKEHQQFTENDQRLLAIIAAQSAQVVENARLYEKERALARMQEDVKLAARIQSELLPKAPPSIPGYDIAGRTLPAQEVGGDYFDFIPIDEHRWAFCLGDVTGKGLPASLLMANLQATLRGLTLSSTSPKSCLEYSNRLLFQSTSPEKFATLFYAILDTRDHQIHFCNAGQDNPFLCSSRDETKRLKTGGIPLGMIPEYTYEDESASFEKGCFLVAYSDGVTEAMNAEEEMFGEACIASLIDQYRHASASELIDKIIGAVKQHAGGYPQSDDITLLVIRRNAD
jgi:sigma-B regulation protein RsbU (phosphoserine phosphatase)